MSHHDLNPGDTFTLHVPEREDGPAMEVEYLCNPDTYGVEPTAERINDAENTDNPA